jgi:hypothetical protein
MRLKSLSICGFRGFNDAQTLDLSDTMVIFEGPNGSGKTSIGEAVEWLLYGRTLKRTKGDDLSKREYSGCYKNAHYIGSAPPYVEAELDDRAGKARKILRELKTDETSVLKVDGSVVQDLKEFGIDHLHDRPLILQHTLQDFIFMKPKARYEVLSAMMGLEPLIALRTAVEAAKTEFSKRLPQRAVQAQSRRTLLVADMRQEPVLVPVVTLIESGRLAAAKQHLGQVAQGLVSPGYADLLQALKTVKSSKERAQLDWGRLSAAVISSPAEAPVVKLLSRLDARVSKIREHLAAAAAEQQGSQREHEPQRRQFYHLGLRLLDSVHPEHCPFCAADSLTPQRIAALREALAETPEGLAAIQKALAEVRGLTTDLVAQVAEQKKVVPNQPDDAEVRKIRDIAAGAAEAFLESNKALGDQLVICGESIEVLKNLQTAIEGVLSSGELPKSSDDLAQVVGRYKAEISVLPAFINGYAANYSVLDPAIKAGLASSADVKKVERTIAALEQWKDVRIAQVCRDVERSFTDLVGDIRTFTERKQKQVLATRDKEIKNWYAMLNPISDVAYDGMVPGTDNLELRARTYAKTMFAAPNLSMSQLNCVGLAIYLACATRKGTPFNTLLIDDPVQSMDDEHTEAFKKQVIEKLLDDVFHIILLTHMQLLAGDVEALYRRRGAALYKISQYSRSGPAIEWKGPGLGRLLEMVRTHKDATNEEYRKTATLNLRMFVEQFVKELYKADTGNPISRKYEGKSWGEIRSLLKSCKSFDINDEAKLEDTCNFTSKHLHPDERMPRSVANSAQLNSHYIAMSEILTKYKPVLGF